MRLRNLRPRLEVLDLRISLSDATGGTVTPPNFSQFAFVGPTSPPTDPNGELCLPVSYSLDGVTVTEADLNAVAYGDPTPPWSMTIGDLDAYSYGNDPAPWSN